MNTIRTVMGMVENLIVSGNSNSIHYNDSKKFIADIPKLFKNVKGVLFNIFGYQPNGFVTNMDFCEAVKEKLDSLNIEYYFDTLLNSSASVLLIAANVTVKFQEYVFIIYELSNDKDVLVTAYEYTENGYKNIREETITVDVKKESHKIVRDRILGSSNPKKIILTSKNAATNTPMMKFLRIALKSKKLIVFDKAANAADSYFKELSKWFVDKSYTKYYILPTIARNYFLTLYSGKIFRDLVTLDLLEPLPYKKSFVLPPSIEKFSLVDADNDTSIKSICLHEKCHQYESRINCHEINDLPENLDDKFDKKIPVIGILSSLSVICVHKSDGYEFLDAWNGLYGKELVISFEEEKPKFCDNFKSEKHTFVVYDLINLMRLPADEICNNKKWTYTITKDSDYPVLLEFDTYDGTKKAASPAFLMAMLLKQHLKAIKKKTGEKLTEIGICLLQKFSEDERKRVEEQLEESCKLLNIHSIFVNA